MRSDKSQRFLIFRDGRFGDILMLSGAAIWLKGVFPGCRVDLMVPAWVSTAIGPSEGFDKVFIWDYSISRFKRLQIIRKLRAEKYTCIFIFEQANRKTKTGFFFGGRFLVSFKNKYSYLCSTTCTYDQNLHETQNFARLLQTGTAHMAAKGISVDSSSPFFHEKNLPPRIVTTSDEKEFVAQYLGRIGRKISDRFVILHPYGSPDTFLRYWPLSHYADLSRRLLKKGIAVIFSAQGAELSPVLAQMQKLKEELPDLAGLLSVTEFPLNQRQFGALLKNCLALVTHDTGPGHLATAVGAPVIALFGTTSPARTGPAPGESPRQILKADFSCSPCDYSDSPEKTKCRAQGEPDCMKTITPEQVLKAAEMYFR